MNWLVIKSLELVLGKRPGEAISCIHSAENPNGCGTSGACSACGLVISILESQLTGQKSEGTVFFIYLSVIKKLNN